MPAQLKYFLVFLLFVVLQKFMLEILVIGNIAIAFPFLLFLLMLPLNWPKPTLYLIAFAVGLIIDILSDNYTNGLHAASCLLMMAVREFWLQVITSSSRRSRDDSELDQQPFTWYLIYLSPLIFIHHLAYFSLSDFTFSTMIMGLPQILLSSIYTFIVSLILLIVFYKPASQ